MDFQETIVQVETGPDEIQCLLFFFKAQGYLFFALLFVKFKMNASMC